MPSNAYFQRFGFCDRQIVTPPQPDLGIIVVIPCFNEPDLISGLESIWSCDRPGCSVEVIVVINSSTESSPEIRLQNELTLNGALQWSAKHVDLRLAFHALHFPDLRAKQAGVGLARKIGMDEAAGRFGDLGKSQEGIIVCFDADCRCERNYLSSIERHFQRSPLTPGCSIYFEHPLEGPLKVYEAIAAYELHLRYYVQALRYSGFPYAHHTIGSCMAVRADVYQKQGGMNKRQAGEDFYFLHKIIPLGGFTDLLDTKVIPSPRASDRVPFGTGRAVREYLDGERNQTYPLKAFLDLKMLFEHLPQLYPEDNLWDIERDQSWPESIRTFLAAESFAKVLGEIRENTANESAFRKRFFHWFNGFQVMKFVHHARDQFYGEGKIEEDPKILLALLGDERNHNPGRTTQELLNRYRELDRRARSFG